MGWKLDWTGAEVDWELRLKLWWVGSWAGLGPKWAGNWTGTHRGSPHQLCEEEGMDAVAQHHNEHQSPTEDGAEDNKHIVASFKVVVDGVGVAGCWTTVVQDFRQTDVTWGRKIERVCNWRAHYNH